jgi:RimJ/RimL family protein N-acetyltransferase
MREEFSGSLWLRSDGTFLGGIGLHPINWNVPSFEIGYWLRKSATGQGYMTEAVRLMTRLAFETLEANRVFIRCSAKNSHSASVARRAGYVAEGALRNAERATDGELYDMLFFGMTPGEYAALQPEYV